MKAVKDGTKQKTILILIRNGYFKSFYHWAGFTKAVFPTAPLNNDLLAQVVGIKPDNTPLGQVWSEYGL